jgi:hypothetical protein
MPGATGSSVMVPLIIYTDANNARASQATVLQLQFQITITVNSAAESAGAALSCTAEVTSVAPSVHAKTEPTPEAIEQSPRSSPQSVARSCGHFEAHLLGADSALALSPGHVAVAQGGTGTEPETEEDGQDGHAALASESAVSVKEEVYHEGCEERRLVKELRAVMDQPSWQVDETPRNDVSVMRSILRAQAENTLESSHATDAHDLLLAILQYCEVIGPLGSAFPSDEECSSEPISFRVAVSRVAAAEGIVSALRILPTGWTLEEILLVVFVMGYSDHLEQLGEDDPELQEFRSNNGVFSGNDWTVFVADIVLDGEGNRNRYLPYDMRCLLRILCNKLKHIFSASDELRHEIGSTWQEVLHYFKLRFPGLLSHALIVAEKYNFPHRHVTGRRAAKGAQGKSQSKSTKRSAQEIPDEANQAQGSRGPFVKLEGAGGSAEQLVVSTDCPGPPTSDCDSDAAACIATAGSGNGSDGVSALKSSSTVKTKKAKSGRLPANRVENAVAQSSKREMMPQLQRRGVRSDGKEFDPKTCGFCAHHAGLMLNKKTGQVQLCNKSNCNRGRDPDPQLVANVCEEYHMKCGRCSYCESRKSSTH